MRAAPQADRSPILTRPLVIGASGQVGGAFHQRLARGGYDVRGTYHSRPRPGLEPFTLGPDAGTFLARHDPTLVILASALTHVDYCESHPDETRQRNVGDVEPLVAWCAAHDLPLIYLSTDYVFDGTNGPYAEDATSAPVNVYGESKLAAEQMVARVPRLALLRITNVFDVGFDDRNFLVRLVASLRERRPVVVPVDQLATPTYATWLADQTVALIERGLLLAPGADRVLNVACDDLVSRFDFANRVASLLGADGALIEGKTTAELHQAARRPLRGGLRNDRLKALLGVASLRLDRALDELAPRLKELHAHA
jgi:dTDP-4-dehydrorhamnose reductase